MTSNGSNPPRTRPWDAFISDRDREVYSKSGFGASVGVGERPALLIHDMAILTDQDRQYVYVVSADSRAERRDIRIGRQIDGLRVVTQGLSAEDEVVVNGVRRIFFPGAPLIAEPVPMDDPLAAAGAPGAAGTDGGGR